MESMETPFGTIKIGDKILKQDKSVDVIRTLKAHKPYHLTYTRGDITKTPVKGLKINGRCYLIFSGTEYLWYANERSFPTPENVIRINDVTLVNRHSVNSVVPLNKDLLLLL